LDSCACAFCCHSHARTGLFMQRDTHQLKSLALVIARHEFWVAGLLLTDDSQR
jgi:hypothetical protein